MQDPEFSPILPSDWADEPSESSLEKCNGGSTSLCTRCDGTGVAEDGKPCYSCGGTGWRR